MFRKKDLERRCVAKVAYIRGGTPEDESGQWPDGWIRVDASHRIPVEVVSAFPERDGSRWARAHTQGEAATRGTAMSWAVCNGRSVVLDGRTDLPPSTKPIDLVVGIFSAVSAKSAHYGPKEAAQAILVLHHVHWPSILDESSRRRVGEHAVQIGAPFREIWIVNEYGDPAQRVPFVAAG